MDPDKQREVRIAFIMNLGRSVANSDRLLPREERPAPAPSSQEVRRLKRPAARADRIPTVATARSKLSLWTEQ